MKRRLTAVMMAVCLLCLCACGQTDTEPADSTVSDTIVSTTTTTTAVTEAETTPTSSDVSTTIPSESTTTTTTGATTTAKPDTTTTKPTTTTVKPAITTKPTTTTTTAPVSSPLLQGSLAGQRLKVGDTMYDGTFTDTNGNTVTLSSLLQGKELVVINFWFINCPWCIKEFPAMSEATAQYKDKVSVVALNPIDRQADIVDFRSENSHLQFMMASGSSDWSNAFRVTGYPTSVLVDKEGIIRKIHTGALLNTADWVNLFEQYLAD